LREPSYSLFLLLTLPDMTLSCIDSSTSVPT
jgi:hypothetical protein